MKGGIADITLEFALQIIGLYKVLIQKREFVISKQLLRSATSVGANIAEANAAQSKRDFVAKMAIASKEARETKYWLELLDKSKLVELDYSQYLATVDSIINILTKIVKTAQRSLNTQHSTPNT